MTATKKKLHPIFRDARHTDDGRRYIFSKAFQVGDCTYATDGRICVRAISDEGEAIDRPPPVSELAWNPGLYVPSSLVIPLRVSDGLPCVLCGGRCHFVRQECECVNVDGTAGEECPTCNGSGFTGEPDRDKRCSACFGVGHRFDDGGLDVGEAHISRQYAALLLTHDVSRLYLTYDTPDRCCVRFKGDGFEGLLMPMNKVCY